MLVAIVRAYFTIKDSFHKHISIHQHSFQLIYFVVPMWGISGSMIPSADQMQRLPGDALTTPTWRQAVDEQTARHQALPWKLDAGRRWISGHYTYCYLIKGEGVVILMSFYRNFLRIYQEAMPDKNIPDIAIKLLKIPQKYLYVTRFRFSVYSGNREYCLQSLPNYHWNHAGLSDH